MPRNEEEGRILEEQEGTKRFKWPLLRPERGALCYNDGRCAQIFGVAQKADVRFTQQVLLLEGPVPFDLLTS